MTQSVEAVRRGRDSSIDAGELRVALISTPRSGNTWFRHLVASSLELEQMPIYNPLEADWANLPGRCILMTHWHRTEPFLSLLHERDFHVLTLVRHPLDVLISILHFSVHNPETGRWVDGDGGDELSIVGKSPLSQEFLEYAMSPRAMTLLSISSEWAQEPASQLIRYEDLVADPRKVLLDVSHCDASQRTPSIVEAIAKNTLENLRAREGLHHWRGRPGHWRQFLPKDLALKIADFHAETFAAFGYTCDPDATLTREQAQANWNESLCAPKLEA